MESRYNFRRENFEMNSIKDIDRVLNENNIIPTYREHLLQLNTCIDMFKQIETDRSLKEIFCDYAAGKRTEINHKRLLDHLENVKNELLEGIEMYMMLLGQREEVRKYLRNLKVTKFKLEKNETNVPKTSPVKKVAVPAITVGSFAIVGAVGGGTCGVILVHYGLLAVSLGTLTGITAGTTAATGGIGAAVGLVVLGVVGAAILIIYKIAKYKGKLRGLKYQQVKELYDALNDENVLSTIKTNHQELKCIFNAINKQIHTDEAYMEIALGVYLETRETSLSKLAQNNPEMSAEKRSEISEGNATTACETYLRHKVQYSEKKIRNCIQTIKRNQAERLNQENGPANDAPENNAENQGEQNTENQGQQNVENQG